MILRVMFKDTTIKKFNNVTEISNISTRFSNDSLRFIRSFDLDYQFISFNDILCFECKLGKENNKEK